MQCLNSQKKPIKNKMQQNTKKLLILGSLAYLTIHAIGKLLINNYDYQHWGVIAAVGLIAYSIYY